MAEGNKGGRIFAYALLAIAIVISYQAWKNGQLSPVTADLAKQHACDMDSSCIVLDSQPRLGKANAIQHQYEFKTTHGIMTLTCQRELIFFGPWSCTPEKGRMVAEPL